MVKKLHILWTTSDVHTAHFMVFMYAINSITKHWWDDVMVIIWGASAKLVMEDESIQHKIRLAMDQGVKVSACIACAAQFGVVDNLRELGIEVIPWGEPLTEIIQSNGYILSV